MFSREDLDVVTGCVGDGWRSGIDRDWSVPAGTLEWSCTKTADHDVCAGLGVRLDPPTDVCERLREHIQDWPHWSGPGWRPLAMTGDPWTDLLLSSGRHPQA